MSDKLVTLSYDDKTKMHSLWGMSGGQLELVSQKVLIKEGRSYMVLRFTDHDVQAIKDLKDFKNPCDELVKGQFYEVEIPLSTHGDLD